MHPFLKSLRHAGLVLFLVPEILSKMGSSIVKTMKFHNRLHASVLTIIVGEYAGGSNKVLSFFPTSCSVLQTLKQASFASGLLLMLMF